MTSDEKIMFKALKLAEKGIGSVEPNPAVGAVLVKDGKVIGKGYHKKFGGPHAEINAIEDCTKKGSDPSGSALYVTLEPCSHHGKTPPCTDAVIQAGISKVFIACLDPSEHANGRGEQLLKNAGIEIHTGLCQQQAKLLNAPFIKFAKTKTPWVIVKWAQTIDGKLSYADQDSNRWISNEKSRKQAHHLRRRVQAVLVGINTVLIDDPLLTPRPAKGKKPARVVLDTYLRTPLNCQLIKTAKKFPLYLAASQNTIAQKADIVAELKQKGAELLTIASHADKLNLKSLLDKLAELQLSQILIEGGSKVITSFLKDNLADEIHIFIAPKILAAMGNADLTERLELIKDSLDLKHVRIKSLDGDTYLAAYTQKALNEIDLEP
ncbi:MAG: bifunctional diaminohydroxyphosphoribosylaminopyrimidine deaminase/5-amino-6-(5-phosphoribosylamino)uracil reductase RibD [Planctomycetota bacterium]